MRELCKGLLFAQSTTTYEMDYCLRNGVLFAKSTTAYKMGCYLRNGLLRAAVQAAACRIFVVYLRAATCRVFLVYLRASVWAIPTGGQETRSPADSLPCQPVEKCGTDFARVKEACH